MEAAMTFPIYDQVIYGDTSGVLGRGEHGGDQTFFLTDPNSVTLIGDANDMIANAVGGNDTLVENTLNSTSIIGDAVTMANKAQGGDDLIGAFAAFDATATGDAVIMSGRSKGGDDAIAVEGRSVLVYGDAETMSNQAQGGDDRITVEAAQGGAAYGDALVMTGQAHGGNDHLEANIGTSGTKLVGDAETMSGHAVGGDDVLTTEFVRRFEPFQIELYGDAVRLTGHAHGGNDSLQGSSDFDSTMYGDGRELLGHAVGGDDTLSSNEGSDIMWGDAPIVGPLAQTGADLFVVRAAGHDQIMDFEPGKDHIEVQGFANFQDLSSLFQPTADGVLISFDPNDDVLVRGVSQLTASDFLFA
jgi:hypothetical protein